MSNTFRVNDEYGQGEYLGPDEAPEVVEMLDEEGNTVYGYPDEMPIPEEEQQEFNFYENLAEHADYEKLEQLSSNLLKEIKDDALSRADWDATAALGLRYLGIKLEETRSIRNVDNLCAAYDSTLMTALVRSYSTAQAELFPPKGPVSAKIVGPKNEQAEKKAEELKTFGNYYLTKVDKPYYDDSQCLLMHALYFGTAFRKVYQDPVLGRTVARMVKAHDLLIDPNTTSLLSASRISQILTLSRREVAIRQAMGVFREEDVPEQNENNEVEENIIDRTLDSIDGVTRDDMDNKSNLRFYESYVDLSSDDAILIDDSVDNPDGIPLPYIVTLCETNRKIYSIYRNWNEGDPKFTKKDYFNKYSPLPGLGIYGIGLLQLIGNSAIVNTSLLRQLVDKGSLSNFPGFIKTEAVSARDNNLLVGIGEALTIETGGQDIRACFMPMPYGEPSQVLNALRQSMKEDAMVLASTGEQKIAETNANAAVGTTLALLEVESRMSSAILRNLHNSLSNELEMLFKQIAENLEGEYQFAVEGKNGSVTPEHFDGSVEIVPVSDPNVMTSTQRIIGAKTRLEIATQYPQFCDLREAVREMFIAVGVTNLDKIMPPPQEAMPLDPVTENANAILGKPLAVAMWQDHPSHIPVHMVELNNPDLSEQTRQSLMAHIQTHIANQYVLDMQQAMGMELPPLEQIQDPQVQNQIALAAAKVAQEQLSQLQSQQQVQQGIDPNALLLADIQQKARATELNYELKLKEFELRKEEADKKQETEAFNTQMRYEADMEKLEVQQEIAEEKNEVDLEKIHVQQRSKS